MQINYCNESVRRSTAGFWYAPRIDNTIQAMDVPPIYAPYGTKYFWPNATVRTQITQTTPDTALVAKNSGKDITVASAVAMNGFGDASAPPAASPATAAATGQSLGPVSLVAPMPSITAPPNTVAPTPAPVCNSVDSWVSANPMLAALGVVGVFLFFGGHK